MISPKTFAAVLKKTPPSLLPAPETFVEALTITVGAGKEQNDFVIGSDGELSDEDDAWLELPEDLYDVDVSKNLEGVRAEKWEHLETLYREHAKVTGFFVRRSTVRLTATKKVRERYIVCYAAGSSEQKKKERGGIAKVQEEKDKAVRGWMYLHRSQRKITRAKKRRIESLEKSCVRPAAAYRCLNSEAQGQEIVGHTQRDQINHINKFRMKQIEGGDVNNLIRGMCVKQNSEEDVFCRVKLEEGQLKVIFWRD